MNCRREIRCASMGKNVSLLRLTDRSLGGSRINGGPAQGGEELRMVEEDSLYGSEMVVGRSYHKLGEVTLQMDENFVLTDDSDPDTPPQVYTAEELFAIRDRLIGEFKPYNTAVTVKNEKIISIYRKFMP